MLQCIFYSWKSFLKMNTIYHFHIMNAFRPLAICMIIFFCTYSFTNKCAHQHHVCCKSLYVCMLHTKDNIDWGWVEMIQPFSSSVVTTGIFLRNVPTYFQIYIGTWKCFWYIVLCGKWKTNFDVNLLKQTR